MSERTDMLRDKEPNSIEVWETRDFDIAEQRRFWNSWNATERERGLHLVEVNLRQARMVTQWIASLGRTDLEILEVGCGSGWFCEQLAEFGRVTGTDLSDEVLSRAQLRVPEASFVAGDFLDLEFPLSHYDVVVSLEVLAHVVDQDAFMAKIARLLRPGGLLMLATQNRFALKRWSEVPPQGTGQLRRWVDAKKLRRLLDGRFEIVQLTSIVPVGNRGILRITNSTKVNALLSKIVSKARIDVLKERLFLGHTLMAMARMRK